MAEEDNANLKKIRKRNKKIINEVQELLEFYFSPSNVSKDRFMQNILNESEYVQLSIFHRFNKIRSITSDDTILSKAVKNSNILELSKDGLKVKSSRPIQMKENEMECTIYVENVPQNATREWLKKVFSPYGNIDYISLPMFQQSQKPKGFAFIEYSNPAEAQKAIDAFGGGLASLDGQLKPADLMSIKTFNKTEEEQEDLPNSAKLMDDANKSENQSIIQENNKNQESKKRSREEAFSEDEKNSTVEAETSKKHKPPETDVKKKKKRKRNKKENKDEVDKVYLRVMSKKEWKGLRNKYLNMQRENMGKLKASLRQYRNYETPNDAANTDYQANKDEKNQMLIDKKSSIPEFIPNVLVEIKLQSPPSDMMDFRRTIKNGRPSVVYIDNDHDDPSLIRVRFKTPEGCRDFLKENFFSDMRLLQGEDESVYWNKILSMWQDKRTKNKKPQRKPRGRDRLLEKALKYDINTNSRIVFED